MKVTKNAIPIQEVKKTLTNSEGSLSFDCAKESADFRSSKEILIVNKYKRIQKRKNHQNSGLDALPEKLKKFLYAETTESKKFMFKNEELFIKNLRENGSP